MPTCAAPPSTVSRESGHVARAGAGEEHDGLRDLLELGEVFSGICLRIPLPPSLSTSPATISVGANPGSTALTRMPKRASSTAQQRVKALIAPFDAA